MSYEFIPVGECEMCGSRHHKVLGLRMNRSQGRHPRRVSGVGVTLKKCLQCELIFADPRPKPTEISEHYGVPPESYWTRPGHWDTPPEYFAREIAEAKRLLRFTPGMTALDIGAGLGKAMVAMQRAGFDVHGIEPSEPFRRHTIANAGIAPERLQLAGIEDAQYAPASFDFITFGAVLEHLQEPGRAIEKVMHWLKPGGVVQAEVPSSRHLVAKLINAFYALNGLNYVTNLSPMHSPYHLYEFSIESFRQHARRFDYEVVEHRHEVCSIYNVPRVLHPLLRSYMARTGTGMQLTVWLQRRRDKT
ncbi:MAG TPA: class I SAM-dependent methyltransferase [Ramlibacter sp.]|uniref:class I SAM-dependent methyltransferase n=1 Tax=Ramlibacter sp. TaxID=1917967 RepID=UPI002ED20740